MKLSVKFQMIAIKPKYTRICVTQKTLETKHKTLNTKHYYLKVLYHTCIAELNLLALRLAANRLSSSAKTLAKSSVSSGVEFRQRTFTLLVSLTFFFFVWLLACFIKSLLTLCCLFFHVDYKNPIHAQKMITQIFCIFYANIFF